GSAPRRPRPPGDGSAPGRGPKTRPARATRLDWRGYPWVSSFFIQGYLMPVKTNKVVLDTHMLVLVSRNGFTKPVRVKAKFYNIESITFDDAMTTEWDLVDIMTKSGFFAVTSFHYDCK